VKLSEELQWRGFINQTTFSDITDLDKQTWTFYHGFDASADSQTIGNLAAMMLDLVFLRHGHKAILLAGGATSLVGDPSGKDTERPFQSEEVIAHNIDRAQVQLKQIFRDQEFTMVNNLDWFKDMNFMWFLRDIGKHFGMSNLVQREYIKTRIGEGGNGMSFTEFTCTLMQGYDYLELFDKYGTTLQLSGADQWGNCLSGIDLIRKARGAEAHILTMPLIVNKATGKKFGKSEDGAVWLDETKTSIYKFYQFWLNVDDAGVIDYMKVYTTLSKEQIEDIERQHKENPSQRIAQKALAKEVTTLVHGDERCESVMRVTDVLFGSAEFTSLTSGDLEELAKEISHVQTNQTIVEVLMAGGVATSNNEAKRLIEGGAISFNGQKVTENEVLSQPGLLKKGKNTFVLVRNNQDL
jgi:tyrosyl-tRNA synthetase